MSETGTLVRENTFHTLKSMLGLCFISHTYNLDGVVALSLG